MAGDEQDLHSEIIIFKVVLRDLGDVDPGLELCNCVDFDALREVVCDGNDLRMVTFNINLLDFPLAESGDVHPEEVLVQNRVFLEVCGCHEAHVHDYVVGRIVVAERCHEMLLEELTESSTTTWLLHLGSVFLFQVAQFLHIL